MGRTSRKDEIKDALKALASECPYDKITIEEIASKSGLNRKTFYYYFSDKKDVVKYTIFSEFFDKVGNDVKKNAREYLESFLSYLYKEKVFYKRIFSETREEEKMIKESFKNALERLISPYMNITCPFSGHNAERIFMVSFFTDALMMSIENWIVKDDGSTPEVMAKRFRYIASLLFPSSH